MRHLDGKLVKAGRSEELLKRKINWLGILHANLSAAASGIPGLVAYICCAAVNQLELLALFIHTKSKYSLQRLPHTFHTLLISVILLLLGQWKPPEGNKVLHWAQGPETARISNSGFKHLSEGWKKCLRKVCYLKWDC